MEEVQKSNVSCQIDDALNTWNELATSLIHDLSFNLPVLVFCERNTGLLRSWKGPYKLLGLKSKSAIIELSNGPTKFCLTLVKPYYNPSIDGIDKNIDKGITNSLSKYGDIFENQDTTSVYVPPDVSSFLAFSIFLALSAFFVSIKH